MSNRLFALILILWGLVFIPQPVSFSAEDDILAGAPPVPPGYESQKKVMEAAMMGKLALIQPPSELPEGVTETLNITYATYGDRTLQLDLYSPIGLSEPTPLIVFIHGGAWKGGSRDIYKIYTTYFAQKGYIAATISYRFSGEKPFPAAVEDAKCAIRFLRANAGKYHIDPDRIAVAGGSAGGHLSMMVGYSADVPELEGDGGNPGISSAVQAVVNFYGPYDLTTPFAQKQGVVKSFLSGKTYEEAPELYRAASPANYLNEGDPPTLIFHGTIDDTVPIDQADALYARLCELGIPVVYEKYEGWPHTMDLAKPIFERASYVMEKFLDKYLKHK